MEQTEGLCAPGSATSTSYVTIHLEPESSQFVTFSVVPMVARQIPIKIRLFDIENGYGIDAIEKTLNVLVSDNIICRLDIHNVSARDLIVQCLVSTLDLTD